MAAVSMPTAPSPAAKGHSSEGPSRSANAGNKTSHAGHFVVSNIKAPKPATCTVAKGSGCNQAMPTSTPANKP